MGNNRNRPWNSQSKLHRHIKSIKLHKNQNKKKRKDKEKTKHAVRQQQAKQLGAYTFIRYKRHLKIDIGKCVQFCVLIELNLICCGDTWQKEKTCYSSNTLLLWLFIWQSYQMRVQFKVMHDSHKHTSAHTSTNFVY